MIQHATSSPFHVKRLAPGHYVRPDGKRVEVLRKLNSCDAYHIVDCRGAHRLIPGPCARRYLKRLTYPHKPPTPAPQPDNPRGSMTVVVYVVLLCVVALLGLGIWAAAHLPKVEWQ